MSATIVILLILAILLIVFTLQNSTEITIQLFFWEIANAPLVLVLLGCIVIGYLFAVFYFYPRLWKLKSENKKLVKLNKKYSGSQVSDPEKGEAEEDHPEGILMKDDKGKFSFFKD